MQSRREIACWEALHPYLVKDVCVIVIAFDAPVVTFDAIQRWLDERVKCEPHREATYIELAKRLRSLFDQHAFVMESGFSVSVCRICERTDFIADTSDGVCGVCINLLVCSEALPQSALLFRSPDFKRWVCAGCRSSLLGPAAPGSAIDRKEMYCDDCIQQHRIRCDLCKQYKGGEPEKTANWCAACYEAYVTLLARVHMCQVCKIYYLSVRQYRGQRPTCWECQVKASCAQRIVK